MINKKMQRIINFSINSLILAIIYLHLNRVFLFFFFFKSTKISKYDMLQALFSGS